MSARVSARRALRVAGFAGVTAALLPAYAVAHALAEGGPDPEGVRDRWTRRWADSLLRVFSIRIEQEGTGDHEPLASTRRGRLVVSNHRSAIDVAVVLRTFGGAMVSRADLSRWPLVGAAARITGTLFVDRADHRSGAAVIRQIRERLAAGDTVCVFPEGTTFAGDVVRPFHVGAFLAALRLDADVVPAGLAYATGSEAAYVDEKFTDHLARMAGSPGARVALVVGEAYAVPRNAKAGALAEEARVRVQALVDRARIAVDSA